MKRIPAALLALLLASPALAAPEPSPGPRVSFERKGDSVCASYAIDGRHHLYRDRVFALAGPDRLPIAHLPAGASKEIAGSRETILDKPFSACAKAASPSAPLRWVDQSCLAAEGVCLPPRAFEIDASGAVRELGGAASASAFAAATAVKDSGWGVFSFKPK